MKHIILEKAERVGIKINDFPIWVGITEEEARRLFLAAVRVPFPKATITDVGKYFSIAKVVVKPTDRVVDFDSQRESWKPHLEALDKFQKADVKPFTRVRRGRMERVKGYARVGARKAIMFGLMAVMATVFAVSPLMAQTKYGGSYWNLGSGQAVSGEGTKEKPFTVQSEKTGKVSKVMSRADFRRTVMGKTPQQVIQAIGKPDGTQETGRLMIFDYHKLTKDSYTGKVDRNLFVHFWDGVVTDVGILQ